MKKENIVQHNARDLSKTSKTNWQRFDAIKDDDIDMSEIPELDDEWFKNARVVLPQETKAISFQIDQEVLQWFKSKAKGRRYQRLMNAVLRAYVRKQKEHTEKANQ